jgi:hypothetical protein
MTTKATAGEDRLHILVEIQMSSRLMAASGGYSQRKRNNKENQATTPTRAGHCARFTNRFVRSTGGTGMRAV